MNRKAVDLDTAADKIGISPDAVRKRIERGTLEGYKDSGRWKVYLPDSGPDNDQTKADTSGQLVEQLKSENEFLRQQLHQQSIIIYNLSESVKLLEAPKDKRPWWKRLFNRE